MRITDSIEVMHSDGFFRNKVSLINFLLILIFEAFLSGCLRTEGKVNIKGEIIDNYTGTVIPGKEVIIHGKSMNENNKSEQIYAGQFFVDSLGHFYYSFNKIKNAYTYSFHLVGDSSFIAPALEVPLFNLKKNPLHLSFHVKRLSDLTIKIERVSKKPPDATLIMTILSDGIDGRSIYPYKIENIGLKSNLNTIWEGEDVKSIIRARVFTDKVTKVRWVLYKTTKIKEVTDTIICKQDRKNEIVFKY